MAALRSRCGHYIFVLFLSSFFPRLISAAANWMSSILLHMAWCGPSANLECRSEMCCTRLAGNAGTKKSPKICHLGTIARLCWAISLQLRHLSTIGKKTNSNVSPTCPYNMVSFGPLVAEICWRVRGTPANFNGVSRLRSVTARHSSSGRQPNFAALNRGRHLYSVGRPSRLALAHISSFHLNCIATRQSHLGYKHFNESWIFSDVSFYSF